MEILKEQRAMAQETIQTLFSKWEEQVLETGREFNRLTGEVSALKSSLKAKEDAILHLSKENTRLKEEISTLPQTGGADDACRWTALVNKHINLLEEFERQKATAVANQRELIRRLKEDREKLKKWNRFSAPCVHTAHSPPLPQVETSPVSSARVHGLTSRQSLSRGSRRDPLLPPVGETKSFAASPLSPSDVRPASLDGSDVRSATPLEQTLLLDPVPQIRRSEVPNPNLQESSVLGIQKTNSYKALESDVHVNDRIPVANEAEPIKIESNLEEGLAASSIRSRDECLDTPATTPQRRLSNEHRALPSPSIEQSRWRDLGDVKSLAPLDTTGEPRVSKSSPLSTNETTDGAKHIPRKLDQRRPLQDVDGNVRHPLQALRPVAISDPKKRTSDERHRMAAIATFAEDGEEYRRKSRKMSGSRASMSHAADPTILQRLDDLLTTQSSRRSSLKQVSKRGIGDADGKLLHGEEKDGNRQDQAQGLLLSQTLGSPSMPNWQSANARQRTLQAEDAGIAKATLGPSSVFSSSLGPPSSTSSHRKTPYRLLPLSTLDLSHFKLNPAANHNQSHAYTDVVRKQSDRKCIPGCTGLQCCGPKFAALAETLPHPTAAAEDAKGTTATPADKADPTTLQLSESDKSLLYSYLGANYHTLAIDAPEANSTSLPSHSELIKTLLHEARTARLANMYGKAHRSSTFNARPPSPPGFWNVDFPTSQEIDRDRQLADQRGREEVRRRWREAMKNPAPVRGKEGERTHEGEIERGLWMFADE